MAIKKRNKVSAEFSMSSLTDIIFLLLIFFMLTSSMIVPNALNLKLPGEHKGTSTVSKRPDKVKISSSGKYTYNGTSVSISTLNKKFNDLRKASKDASVIVAAHPKSDHQHVVDVLDLAQQKNINAILSELR